MGFQIRDAEAADGAALRDVFRRASLSNDGDRGNLLANPDVLEFPGAAVNDGRTRVAAAADGRVIGFATALTGGDAIELDDLFVDPGWMGRGVGRALVLDVVAIARDQLAGRIEVTANPHALAFYQKVGFIVDHEVQTRFGPGSRMHLDVAPGGTAGPASAAGR
jgi:GNAT superfamily N-acetyltransferase